MTYENHPVPSDAESNEYATPEWLTSDISDSIPGGFDLDPASGAESREIADKRHTKEDDGLAQPWEGYVWCNPPWSSPSNDGRMKQAWLRKARAEVHRGNAKAVFMLLPDDVSTQWFRDHSAWGTTLTFLGRIRYGDGNKNPPFGSMLLGFGDIPEETVCVLDAMGPTYHNRHRTNPERQTTIEENCETEGEDQ